MKKNKLILIFLFAILGCTNKYNKKHPFFVSRVCDHVYVQTFTVFGQGALGADELSYYITDSISFRKFCGLGDGVVSYFKFECIGDSVKISRFDRDKKETPIETTFYSITQLKESKHME